MAQKDEGRALGAETSATVPSASSWLRLFAVQDILMKQLGVEREQLTCEARLMEDLSADSLDVVQIVMNLEEHFQLTVSDEEAEGVASVGGVYEVTARMLGRTGVSR